MAEDARSRVFRAFVLASFAGAVLAAPVLADSHDQQAQSEQSAQQEQLDPSDQQDQQDPTDPSDKDAQPAAADLAVPRHEAVYHATARGIPIRARLSLEAQGDGLYVYRFRAEPRGLFGFINRGISETSLVMVGQDGAILPLSYRKRDEFGGRNTDMRFDLADGEVHVEYRDRSSVSEWEPGIYDLMSLRLVLANDLARGALRETYRYIDDRSRIEAVEVTVEGRETLSTPIGDLETVRLAYSSDRKDRRFTLWIAPEMDAALVRFEQHEDGKLRGSLEIVEYQRL